MIKQLLRFNKQDWKLILTLFKEMLVGLLTFDETKIKINYLLLELHMCYQSKKVEE